MTTPGRIDWIATDKNVIAGLSRTLVPEYYRHACENYAIWSVGEDYSGKTDPDEKFRQHYSEHQNKSIAVAEGGWVVLRRWFDPVGNGQLNLFAPLRRIVLLGDPLLSYDTGFEQAKRQPHMKDHFGDANTDERYLRRRRGALVESHVKDYFKKNYSSSYIPPSNEGLYDRWASEDFFLSWDGIAVSVDVKTPSYIDDFFGGGTTVARNIRANHVYIIADWVNEKNTVGVAGFLTGSWFVEMGSRNYDSGLTHINERYLWDFDVLLVRLNLAGSMLSYTGLRNTLYKS